MSNRVPRRQGVTHGPPRPELQSGANSKLIARVLGMGMVGLALAVLAGGVVLVNRPPAATPTRQVGPTTSPPAQSPSPPASVQPTAAPTPAGPTPNPTPFRPIVQVGPGFVTFGTQLNPDQTVADPQATFVPNDRIAWSGFLTEATDAADVTVRLFKLDDAAPNGERLLSEGDARPQVKDSLQFSRKDISPNRALDGPGIYVVRYVRAEVVLAEGYFELGG